MQSLSQGTESLRGDFADATIIILKSKQNGLAHVTEGTRAKSLNPFTGFFCRKIQPSFKLTVRWLKREP